MAVYSPVSTPGNDSDPTKSPSILNKGRRKSVASSSPRTGKEVDFDQKSRESRMKNAVNTENSLADNNVIERRKTRRSVSVLNTVSEKDNETDICSGSKVKNKSVTCSESKNADEPLQIDANILTAEETPEAPKSKSRRRSSMKVPVPEIQSEESNLKGRSSPSTVSATNTPVNRRRSMRVLAISNSMQKAGTPLGLHKVQSVSMATENTVEIAREKDVTIANEISVDTGSSKCPADFDSTGDDSLLQLNTRRKKENY